MGLKDAEGCTRVWPSMRTVAAIALSPTLLSLAFRTPPLSAAYAVQTGAGTGGTALLGIWLVQEPAELPRFLCFPMFVTGIAGLKSLSSH